VQVIINLARDFIWEYPDGVKRRPISSSLVVGARATYEIVDTSDMADLVGIVFEPGAFTCFAGDAADRFSDQNVALEGLWGVDSRGFREQLWEATTPTAKLRCAERFLRDRFSNRLHRCKLVQFALWRFEQSPLITTVSNVARETGWSERHFSQRFREEVGLSPKSWCRLRRFQRALQQLHAGEQVRWAEMALDCGYYDQAHFANEFRAFSGLDATSYSTLRTRWANHLPAQ
jgi:AraC-like DNA-binding protein